MIDKILDDEIKTILLTAETIYLNFWQKRSSLDASLILIEYGKSLEMMLHKQVSPIFEGLIEKFKPFYYNKTLSKQVRRKFGNLFNKKSIGLGTWKRILEDFKESIVDQDLREFKDVLFARFDDVELDTIHKVCKFLVKERNPSSHIELHSINYVISLRKRILKMLNKVIEIFY